MALATFSKFSRIFFGSRRFTPLSHQISSELERVGGQVVIDRIDEDGDVVRSSSIAPPQPQPHRHQQEDTIPVSINMLVTNGIEVEPQLLLRALPWDSVLQHPATTLTAESKAELTRLYEQLQRWKAKGDIVAASYAADICYRVGACLHLREIDRLLHSVKEDQGLEDLFQQVFGKDIDFDKIKLRCDNVMKLLEEGKVHDAYQIAQAALNSMNSAHFVLESVEEKVYESQSKLTDARLMALGMTGMCVVVGVSCYYLATIPELYVPIIESALTNAATTGAVVFLTAAAVLYFRSTKYKSYKKQLSDARHEFRRLRLKLDNSINECFDRGFRVAT